MKVLCAVDGSKHSQWVQEVLQRWSFPKGSGLVLLHVVDIAKFRSLKGMGIVPIAAMKRAQIMANEIGRGLLERMREILKPCWDVVEGRIVKGHPAEAIVGTAEHRKADLIVMGSRGLTDVRGFLLGSVSRQVVMHAGCPVLLIKKRVPVLRRIIVAVDGSRQAWAGVEYLLELSVPEAANILVVSVIPPLPIDTSDQALTLGEFLQQLRAPLREKAQSEAKKAADRIEKAGFDVKTVVVHGHPSQEIVKLAEAEKADLVVMGARGLTGNVRFLMGSVSDGVIKYAPCAVLVVRH